MRRNEPVTQKEQTYPDAFNLIATTDLQGKITAANEAFPEVSGYTARNRKISVAAVAQAQLLTSQFLKMLSAPLPVPNWA